MFGELFRVQVGNHAKPSPESKFKFTQVNYTGNYTGKIAQGRISGIPTPKSIGLGWKE